MAAKLEEAKVRNNAVAESMATGAPLDLSGFPQYQQRPVATNVRTQILN